MKQHHTDIVTTGFIAHLPLFIRPYAVLARVDRFIGTWLLLLPCFWSIALSKPFQYMGVTKIVILHLMFFLGAFFMRSAGCVVNDLWDRNYDKQVERTKMRPLASGELKPYQAIIFLLILLLLSFFIFLYLSTAAKILAVASLIPVALYPLAKRFTRFPQIVLGVVFNWGALMGWAAVTNQLSWAAIWLWLGGTAWTLIYDTIYAHQDKNDDMAIGLKSTAITFGENTKIILAVVSLLMGVFLMIAANLSHHGLVLYIAIILMVIFHIIQLIRLDINNPVQCLTAFKQARYAGWLLLAGIWLSNLTAC